jgi:CHAT domain-containing protein
MPGHGKNNGQLLGWRGRSRIASRAVALAGILSFSGLTGCQPARPSPEALFDSVYTEYVHGNLEAAYTHAEQARKGQPPGPWLVKFQLLEADILVRRGQLDEVVRLLSCDGPPSSARDDATIKRRLLCGRAHARLEKPTESAQELQSAHQLAQLAHSPLIADVLHTEGLIARDAGRLEEASEKFKGSLVAARNNADRFLEASNLIDIGFNNMQSAHFGEALTLLLQGAEVAHSIGARWQMEMATGNLGWTYQNLGDFDSSLPRFQDAEQQARGIGMTAHRVVWLQDAGLAEYRLGNLDAARKYDEEALSVAQTLPPDKEVDQIANIQVNIALLLHEQGQYAAAKRYSDAAVATSTKSKDNVVVAYCLYMRGLITSRIGTAAQAEEILMSALKLDSDPDLRAEIQSAIAKLYADRQQNDTAATWYRRSIQTFETKRATVGDEALRLSTFAYGQGIYRDYADLLIKTNHPLDALQLLDRSRSRTLDEGLGSHSSADSDDEDPRAVARILNASILFYSLGREQSRLWVVTPRQTQLFTLPDEQHIKSLVNEHQSAIQQALDPDTAAYATLVKPAASLVPAGSRVFVIADGALHGLNFETLQTGGLRYWIEDVAITSASSIRMLSRSKAAAPLRASRQLLLIGDPMIPKGRFAPLPDAPKEIQQVRQHFQPDSETVISQERAVPAAYAASHPEDFRYIHFATHGTASPLSPLDSAVVLSPPPQEPEAFKLYARDIVQHPLNATLVTISACYGSGVRTYAGEGLVGLAWVFLRAGAHNVIAALWQVSDAASPLLMDQLYSELQDGKAPDEALRAAKLSLLHSSRIYRKPLFWGAFQLYAGA